MKLSTSANAKRAASALLILILVMASTSGTAATYSVGEGGDYASLKAIYDSGILTGSDVVVVLSDDNSLAGTNVSFPKGITIRGQEGSSPVIFAGQISEWPETSIVLENLTFNGSTGYLINGADIDGSSNLVFDGFSRTPIFLNNYDIKNLTNITFQNSSSAFIDYPDLFFENIDGLFLLNNTGSSVIASRGIGFTNANNIVAIGNSGTVISSNATSFRNLTNAYFSNNGTAIYGGEYGLNINGGSNIVFENNERALVSVNYTWDEHGINISNVDSMSFINNGAAITANSASFVDSNVKFHGNSSHSGAAINIKLLDDLSILRMQGGYYEFVNNSAIGTEASGGAIAAPKVILGGGGEFLFSENKAIGAEASGGAISAREIFLGGGGEFLFSENSAAAYGGAIYAKSNYYLEGHLEVTNGTFINNSAGTGNSLGYGGAVYVGRIDAYNSSFQGNSATGYGGAIYALDRARTSIIHDTNIIGNSAGIAGGGIYTKGNLTLSASAGNSTVISGNTAAGRSDGIYMETIDYYTSKLTVDGAGTVILADTVRAEGSNSVNFNKNGSGSLIWGNNNYFSNNSSLNFNEGKTTLSDNFSLQSRNMSLNLAAGHSLYLDLTNRDRDLAYFDGLAQLSVAAGSSLVLSFDGVLGLEDNLDLGSWLFADLWGSNAGIIDELSNFALTLLVDGVSYYGAFFEIIDNSVWINMAGISTTPIPASALLLGTGLAALIRLRRRTA